MTGTRAQLEMFVVTVGLALLLGAALSRTLAMADRTQARSFAIAGAHFIAGLEMVQAESRLAQRRKLNALGYPTGRSGALQDDADCDLIWSETMREGSVATGHYVADSDGSGDRCEFVVAGTTAESSIRILYWPMGATAATVSLGRETIHVMRGAHVHVAVEGVSS
jgi:hypothetical protein